jgi:NDP-sugar pyrophosphorylase family protein
VHGLILAGGEGSRLAADGVRTPKALVEVAGQPQIVRLVDTMTRLGCRDITCMVREGLPPVATLLPAEPAIPVDTITCLTPSSLHTLVAGLTAAPHGAVFCSMVDTVMPWADWQRAFAAVQQHLGAGADAVLVVTPATDDDRPLYVGVDAGGRVRSIGDQRVEPATVTGGVYGFGAAARRLAADALDQGLERMRAFLGLLVQNGRAVFAVNVPRVIDLDRARDLADANAWLGAHA